MDTVRFKSNPPGADVKAPNGQTCRTPCALPLPTDAPMTVTFALNGYLPESADIEPVSSGIGAPQLRPNPVQVELAPAPPPPKPVKTGAQEKGLGSQTEAKAEDFDRARPCARCSSAGAAAGGRALAGHAAAAAIRPVAAPVIRAAARFCGV